MILATDLATVLATVLTHAARRLMTCLVALLCLLAWPRNARAETWGQYLVVIDDSGSMNGSDPERLVMLASLAIAAALGDGDQIMVAGLNQLAKGDAKPRFVSPRELLRERDGSEGERPLVGEAFDQMALHGGATPCKQALARAESILDSVAA